MGGCGCAQKRQKMLESRVIELDPEEMQVVQEIMQASERGLTPQLEDTMQVEDLQAADEVNQHNAAMEKNFQQFTPNSARVLSKTTLSRSKLAGDTSWAVPASPRDKYSSMISKFKRGQTIGKENQGDVLVNFNKPVSIAGSGHDIIQNGFDDKINNLQNVEQLGEAFLQSYNISFACKKGLKPQSPNQDDFCITLEGDTLVIGVFDGHGQFGHDCSNFVHTFLPTAILQERGLAENPINAIQHAYEMTQTGLKMEAEKPESQWDCMLSGTTATVAVICEKKLFISHVGDSRAVLGFIEGNEVKPRVLCRDHKPTHSGERKRIAKKGGQVRKDQDDLCHRIYHRGKPYPGLNMSRSIGDLVATSVGVISQPEVQVVDLTPDMQFILICSDGVWEFLSNDDAIKIVRSYGKGKIQEAAEALAYRAWN